MMAWVGNRKGPKGAHKPMERAVKAVRWQAKDTHSRLGVNSVIQSAMPSVRQKCIYVQKPNKLLMLFPCTSSILYTKGR